MDINQKTKLNVVLLMDNFAQTNLLKPNPDVINLANFVKSSD